MLAGHADPARRALGIHLTQAVAIWFVSLPVMVAMFERSEPGVLFVVGVLVWAVGFGFESIGDWQLARFRADPASAGKVMDRGLWRFTRHPNYFGDATMWWGIWLVAAQQWQGVVTVLSPALMTWTLTRKTGTPLLERGLAERRPGYRDYVERTSGFLPLPPRKRAA
jgi:steroid 5-alpha reductase family enzyme